MTEPLLAVLDDERRSVIKIFNNCQGNLTLVNEYICYQIATFLNLPMPMSGICQCDDLTVDPGGYLSPSNLGYGFYSVYQEKNALLKIGIMKHVQNIDIFYKLIMFDHLVYNGDRNLGNLIVEYKKAGVFISVIDHSHVFKNGTIWDSHCFRFGMNECDYRDTTIMEKNETLYNMFTYTITVTKELLLASAREIQQILNSRVLDSFFKHIPREWGVCEAELAALKNYILYRLEHLEDICNIIYDYIKQ